MNRILAAAAFAAAVAAPAVAQMGHAHGQAQGDGRNAAMAAMHGAEARVGPIAIEGAFARAAAASGGASAAYMTITTDGAADTLVAAASPAARKVELHTHTLDDQGVARMRQVMAIAVEPGETTVLKPGGLHVMLMGLTQELAEGGALELTLTFEQAGDVTLTLPVVAVGGGMKHGS
jgi:copper(I)-binding protein